MACSKPSKPYNASHSLLKTSLCAMIIHNDNPMNHVEKVKIKINH